MADVLVVDDDELAGRVAVLLLQEQGHRAVARRTGRDALSFLAGSARPKLVLLDMLMPDMSGLELLRAIRDDEHLRDLPVVMYTAISDPEVREQAQALGARDYLVKGQSWDEVYPQIEKHIQ